LSSEKIVSKFPDTFVEFNKLLPSLKKNTVMNVVGAAPKRWLFYGAMISQYNYPFDGSPAFRRSRSKLAEEVGAIRISLL